MLRVGSAGVPSCRDFVLPTVAVGVCNALVRVQSQGDPAPSAVRCWGMNSADHGCIAPDDVVVAAASVRHVDHGRVETIDRSFLDRAADAQAG